MIAFFFFGGRGEILECHRAISEAGGRKNEYFYDIFVRSKNFVRILQCRLGSVEDNKEYTDRSHAPGSRAGWIETPINFCLCLSVRALRFQAPNKSFSLG